MADSHTTTDTTRKRSHTLQEVRQADREEDEYHSMITPQFTEHVQRTDLKQYYDYSVAAKVAERRRSEIALQVVACVCVCVYVCVCMFVCMCVCVCVVCVVCWDLIVIIFLNTLQSPSHISSLA